MYYLNQDAYCEGCGEPHQFHQVGPWGLCPDCLAREPEGTAYVEGDRGDGYYYLDGGDGYPMGGLARVLYYLHRKGYRLARITHETGERGSYRVDSKDEIARTLRYEGLSSYDPFEPEPEPEPEPCGCQCGNCDDDCIPF